MELLHYSALVTVSGQENNNLSFFIKNKDLQIFIFLVFSLVSLVIYIIDTIDTFIILKIIKYIYINNFIFLKNKHLIKILPYH